MVCPRCRRLGVLSPSWTAPTLRGVPLTVNCPAGTDFIGLQGRGEQPLRLYVDAQPPARQPIRGIADLPEDGMPPRLVKAFESTLRVYEIGEAGAAAVSCRRVLEGSIGSLIGDDQVARQPLA